MTQKSKFHLTPRYTTQLSFHFTTFLSLSLRRSLSRKIFPSISFRRRHHPWLSIRSKRCVSNNRSVKCHVHLGFRDMWLNLSKCTDRVEGEIDFFKSHLFTDRPAYNKSDSTVPERPHSSGNRVGCRSTDFLLS